MKFVGEIWSFTDRRGWSDLFHVFFLKSKWKASDCGPHSQALCVWIVNAFQCWPGLLVPSVFFRIHTCQCTYDMFTFASVCILLAIRKMWSFSAQFGFFLFCCSVHSEKWNVMPHLLFFWQRQHLQRFEDGGDGASSPGGSGREAPAHGIQGNETATQTCHFLLELTSGSQ